MLVGDDFATNVARLAVAGCVELLFVGEAPTPKKNKFKRGKQQKGDAVTTRGQNEATLLTDVEKQLVKEAALPKLKRDESSPFVVQRTHKQPFLRWGSQAGRDQLAAMAAAMAALSQAKMEAANKRKAVQSYLTRLVTAEARKTSKNRVTVEPATPPPAEAPATAAAEAAPAPAPLPRLPPLSPGTLGAVQPVQR